MRIGFVHGVINTDNVSIAGDSFDFGPCAFLDVYHPEMTFSSIDQAGRYSFSQQPFIAGWNMARFAETLIPLVGDDKDKAIEILTKIVKDFSLNYREKWLEVTGKKMDFHKLIQKMCHLYNHFFS